METLRNIVIGLLLAVGAMLAWSCTINYANRGSGINTPGDTIDGTSNSKREVQIKLK